jgi:hypothetical protein
MERTFEIVEKMFEIVESVDEEDVRLGFGKVEEVRNQHENGCARARPAWQQKLKSLTD